METPPQSEFEQASEKESQGSMFSELWLFLRHNRKWWLLPILVLLALFGVLMLLAGSGAAPFIYTLF
jgi:hypothetical protein